MTAQVKVRVIGAAAGWSLPVLGPNGDQVREPIRASGTPFPFPKWTHHVALKGHEVELTAAEAERLLELGAVELVKDKAPEPVRAPVAPAKAQEAQEPQAPAKTAQKAVPARKKDTHARKPRGA